MRPGYDIIAETWQAAAADSSGLVYAYAMNDRQSVTNETVISDADSQTLIREHDGFLRRVSLDACGLSVRYGHDSENRMSTASNDVFSVPYAYTLVHCKIIYFA